MIEKKLEVFSTILSMGIASISIFSGICLVLGVDPFVFGLTLLTVGVPAVIYCVCRLYYLLSIEVD